MIVRLRRNTARKLASVLAICAASVHLLEAHATPEQVFQNVADSVVTIENRTGKVALQGSAVAIGRTTDREGSTLLATNAHVVGVARTVQLRTSNGDLESAEVVWRDSEIDLAILHLLGKALLAVPVRSADQLKVGEPVFAIGSPLGLGGSLSQGIVSAIRQDGNIKFIQTTAPISSGNSGGGLFGDDGRLVGITSFSIRDGENLNFAIDAGLIETYFEAEIARAGLERMFRDEPHEYMQADRFISFLMVTAAPSGRSVANWLSTPESAEQLNARDENRVRKHIDQVRSVIAQFSQFRDGTGGVAQILDPQAASFTLVCGNEKQSIYVLVDPVHAMVNVFHATFDESAIQWSMPVPNVGVVQMKIDRRTGFLRETLPNGITLPNTSCSRAPAPKF